MAQGTASNKSELFIKRAKQFNLAFIVSITVLFAVCLALYRFFSMPVSAELILYVYGIEIFTAVLGYTVAFIVRRKLFPVKTSEEYWSYTAVRRYFWSYVLICVPFAVAFVFFIFAGSFSALLLGFFLSLCGLIVFRPKKGDVI